MFFWRSQFPFRTQNLQCVNQPRTGFTRPNDRIHITSSGGAIGVWFKQISLLHRLDFVLDNNLSIGLVWDTFGHDYEELGRG